MFTYENASQIGVEIGFTGFIPKTNAILIWFQRVTSALLGNREPTVKSLGLSR